MGFLDDVFTDALSNLGPSGRTDKKLEQLMAEGELVPARIYAIRQVEHVDNADDYFWGLDAQTSNGPLRASVRQQLFGHTELATLGAFVKARHMDGKVAIDWPATLKDAGVDDPNSMSNATKFLKKPLEPGIEDTHMNKKKLEKNTPGVATVLSFEMFTFAGMPTENWNIQIEFDRGGQAETTVLKRNYVPNYALALLHVGAKLPITYGSGNKLDVTVNWPKAAEDAAPA